VRRVLVTGAGGMLGAEVVRTLSGTADVTAVDVGDFDITDEAATRTAVRAAAPDVVVNCAAYTDVDGAERERDKAFAVNARGAGNVARAAAAAGACLLHVSTDYVFDGSKGRPYVESDEPRPLGAYGESKLAGEREVMAAGGTPLIARTAWLYGRHGRNFVESILDLAARGGPLRVVDDQVGPPTSARDLSVIIAELIPTGATGVVHATNSGSCSWYRFACEILEVAGIRGVEILPIRSEEFPRPAARPAYSVLALDRLVSLIGWLPRPWEEALREYIGKR
jgi:dTDP-4-dehydrorhamnose reductase